MAYLEFELHATLDFCSPCLEDGDRVNQVVLFGRIDRNSIDGGLFGDHGEC